jgi:hypothetical protein
MGYRILSVGFDEDPSSAVLEWVKQFCAYAEWYGAGPSWELREEDGALRSRYNWMRTAAISIRVHLYFAKLRP